MRSILILLLWHLLAFRLPKFFDLFVLVSKLHMKSLMKYSLRGSSQNFEIFFNIGPILLKFSHNM